MEVAAGFLMGIGFGVGLFVPMLFVIVCAVFCLWWFGRR